MQQKRPFESRLVRPPEFNRPEKSPPLKYVWFRTVDKLPDDEALHRGLLAYVSDFHLLDTALRPHAMTGFCMRSTAPAPREPAASRAAACLRAMAGWSQASAKRG
jgi:acyl-CoA thioesterase II